MQAGKIGEWREGWPVILAAVVGTFTQMLAMSILAPLLPLIEQDLNWSRSEISAGASFFFIVSFLLMPVLGAVIDKLGVRIVGSFGVLLFGLGLTCLSFAGPEYGYWIFGWVLLAIAYSAMNPSWATGVSGHFSLARGLALAVALSGAGIASAIAPYLTSVLAEAYGWRATYLLCAALPFLLTFPMMALFFRDARFANRSAADTLAALKAAANSLAGSASSLLNRRTGSAASAAPKTLAAPTAPGLTVGQIFRSRQFWQLSLAGFLIGSVTSGLSVHLVAMLIEIGQSTLAAAALMASLGIGMVVGRLVGGYLLDRFHGGQVASAFMIIAAVGVAGLMTGYNNALLLACALFVIGFAIGTETDCVPYLCSKYFGLANLALAVASLGGIVALGASMGPLVAGWIYDSLQSYWRYQFIVASVFVVAAFSFLGLGRYPHFEALPRRDALATPTANSEQAAPTPDSA
jgi:MFS family permease